MNVLPLDKSRVPIPGEGVRNLLGARNKFIVPAIANGTVYVGTTNGVGVFGPLPPRRFP